MVKKILQPAGISLLALSLMATTRHALAFSHEIVDQQAIQNVQLMKLNSQLQQMQMGRSQSPLDTLATIEQAENTRLQNELLRRQLRRQQEQDSQSQQIAAENFAQLYTIACERGIPDLVLAGKMAPIYDSLVNRFPEVSSVLENKLFLPRLYEYRAISGLNNFDTTTIAKGAAVIDVIKSNGSTPPTIYATQVATSLIRSMIDIPEYRNPECGKAIYQDWNNFHAALLAAGKSSN
jgi:hypothetical protein